MSARKYTLTISRPALDDRNDIIRNSVESFGLRQAQTYLALIEAAFDLIETDPFHPASRSEDGILEGLRSLHLRHAKKRARASHLLFYGVRNDQVRVRRILHEAMDHTVHVDHPKAT